ncbi:MAG: PQQ-dependent sugar dehydrogenase, partial [Gemmatimonadetes bacterium]|nr:PQQ-dependent sugar dehydrogenase [Gemmatimonadota bacterium]
MSTAAAPGPTASGRPGHRPIPTAYAPLWAALPLLAGLGACGEPAEPPPLSGGLALVEVVRGLDAPVFLTGLPGDERLFVVEQPGRVRIVRNGVLAPTPFLDLTDRVGAGGERGVLGLAFAPDYPASGHVFVDYTDRSGDTRVARFTRGSDPDRIDPGTEVTVLTVEQPFSNHNGGD